MSNEFMSTFCHEIISLCFELNWIKNILHCFYPCLFTYKSSEIFKRVSASALTVAAENYPKKMLDGWYCRSIANMQANETAGVSNTAAVEPARPKEQRKEYSSDSSSDTEQEPNYEAQYLTLKKKLKYLIYENECFQDALRSSQKRLLKVSRDRSYLLDRLLQYEKPDSTTSESEDTESSDDAAYNNVDVAKRKKHEANTTHRVMSTPSALNKNVNAVKRKRAAVQKKPPNTSHSHPTNASVLSKVSPVLGFGLSTSDGHMTPEEVERHLQSRQSYLELLPERAPPTVPTEMFSNDPSLDSESNDVLENSPNVEEWFD